MTLILALSGKGTVFMASDRLIAEVSGKPFDPLANKNVIYFARDAVVSIGYTGIAFIGKIPTDQWIVEQLRGEKFPQSKPLMGLMFGKTKQHLDIGQSIRTLVNGLRPVLQMSPVKEFGLIAVGWKFKKNKLAAPIGWFVTSDSRAKLKFGTTKRNWHLSGSDLRFNAMPASNFSKEYSQALKQRLLQCQSSQAVEDELVGAIRLVSKTIPKWVGPDCMSIFLNNPNKGALIRVRYCPNGQSVLVSRQTKSVIPVAFSPWILSPRITIAPSVMVGGWETRIGLFRIVQDAPAPTEGVIAALAPLKRRIP